MGEAKVSSVPPLNSGEETSFVTSSCFGKGGRKDPKRPFCRYQRPYARQCCAEESVTRARLKFIHNEVEDPFPWVFNFLSYIAIASRSKNVDVADLAGYAQIIIHIAQGKSGRPMIICSGSRLLHCNGTRSHLLC